MVGQGNEESYLWPISMGSPGGFSLQKVRSKPMESKKYYINLEVTPEFIQANGLNPKEIEWGYVGRRRTRVYKVQVTREQYLAYMDPVWNEEKREQRARAWQFEHETSRLVSLDKLFEDTEFEFADPHYFLEDLCKQQTIYELRHALEKLEELDRTIAILFSENWTEAEIGKKVGLSQKAVNKRKKKIFALLKELLEKKK